MILILASSDSLKTVILPSRIYFYRGIANPVEIKVFESEFDSIHVIVNGCEGRVSRLREDLYMVILKEFGNFTLTINVFNNNEEKTFTSRRFQLIFFFLQCSPNCLFIIKFLLIFIKINRNFYR